MENGEKMLYCSFNRYVELNANLDFITFDVLCIFENGGGTQVGLFDALKITQLLKNCFFFCQRRWETIYTYRDSDSHYLQSRITNVKRFNKVDDEFM